MTTRLANVPTEPQAFVAWENRRTARYELIGGEVRLMAGGSRAHDVVAGNILAALHAALRGKGCDVHGSNLKIVSPAGMVTYPDVFVRCGPLADEAIECQDPVVVFEVLSPSTRSEDRVRKRWGYQAIPTLAHLVYVDAARIRIEIATRASDGRWWSSFLDRSDESRAGRGACRERASPRTLQHRHRLLPRDRLDRRAEGRAGEQDAVGADRCRVLAERAEALGHRRCQAASEARSGLSESSRRLTARPPARAH